MVVRDIGMVVLARIDESQKTRDQYGWFAWPAANRWLAVLDAGMLAEVTGTNLFIARKQRTAATLDVTIRRQVTRKHSSAKNKTVLVR